MLHVRRSGNKRFYVDFKDAAGKPQKLQEVGEKKNPDLKIGGISLTREQVRAILPSITRFADTGRLGKSPTRQQMTRRDIFKENGFSSSEAEPNWNGKCDVCGASPIMPLTGMCGPCTFGEADTIDGNW